MPKALENKLEHEASRHGYKKGSERYNAYVYGTMNIIEHNKAGGPEKVFEGKNPFHKMGGASTQTHPKVHGVHIGITMAIIIVAAYFIFKGPLLTSSTPSPAQVNPWVPTSPYPGYASYKGWVNTQYGALGAYAGALNGQSD